MDVAAIGSPVEAGLRVGQPDPKPRLTSLLNHGGQAIVVDDGLKLRGS
jgi:hypothetical protein